MSWLNRITTKDGKLGPSGSTSGKNSKYNARSITQSPSLPKISLPPAETATPKLVLTQDDDSASPMTVSPNSIHRSDSMTHSQENLGRENGTHRKYATVSNDDISGRPFQQANGGTTTPSKPGSRSRSNSQSEDGANFPLTESPTQSIGSQRSGSIGSGESVPFQSLSQVVSIPAADSRPRVRSTTGVFEKEDTTGSPKKRRASRQHASSVGASSSTPSTPRFGKPQARHQTTMGMGLASALVASGMGIAPPPNMLSSPTSGLSPPTLTKKASSISANSVGVNGRTSPERTRVSRPRPRSSSSNSRLQDDSGEESDYDSGDALSFNDDEIPITGFAVATMKRNQDFHELFPQVPSDDYLIDGMWHAALFYRDR